MLLVVNMVPGIILKACIFIIVFLIGAVVFSFLNVVVARLPVEDGEKISTGRSKCPHCGHEWRIRESIPIFSWLYNKRKCVYCFETISPRYTLVELLGGILAVSVVVYYGLSPEALTLFLVYCILTTIAFIDADTQYIPPVLNIILAVLGVISIWTLPGPGLLERVIGVFCISVPLLLIVLIIPGGFGGGDIKMMAAAGVLLGWKANVAAFLIGVILGGVYGIYVLVTKKKGRKDHFAFGPFLSIGIAVAAYGGFGTYIVDLYLNMIKGIMVLV